MKIGIIVAFAVSLFLMTQRAANLHLAYFSFFPLGVLVLFYYYDLRDYLFMGLSISLLLLALFFRLHVFQGGEAVAFGLATAACMALMIYYRSTWQRASKREEARWQGASKELEELKQKREVRMESLRHLEKQVASLINLFEIARDFNECLDFKETTQILYKKVLPEVPFEKAELILVAPGSIPAKVSRVYLISGQGIEVKDSLGEGAVEHQWLEKTFREKASSTMDDAWLFPLIPEGEFSALFAVRGIDKEDLAKFEVLASQLSLQVRKIQLYEMVRELSIIDGLTGVFVRRHFLERFEEELRRALKHGFPLAVLMLDIDHFKRYNDDYGHLVGDVTLREVAEVIRGNVRNVDIVARYGGEEFVVVVPDARQAGALEAAERIRSAVARKSFRGFEEETKVTVSVGVSIFPDDVAEIAKGQEYDPNVLFELLQRSDRALYWAKEEGRNRVVVYSSLKRS